jgi:hypothetical protein
MIHAFYSHLLRVPCFNAQHQGITLPDAKNKAATAFEPRVEYVRWL